MAREKKNKNEIVLSKENLLIQPLALTLSGLDPTVIGNRVSVAFVRRLQEAFKEIISRRKKGEEWEQLSIFSTDVVKKKYLNEDNKIEFDIHMKELVDGPKHYQDAFGFVCRLADIKIYIPKLNKAKNGYDSHRESLFDVVFRSNTEVTLKCRLRDSESEKFDLREKMCWNDYSFGKRDPKKIYEIDEERNKKGFYEFDYLAFSYEKNTEPVIGITVSKSVAEYVLSFEKKYGDFLDYTAVSTSDKYYTPIYIFISSYKYNKDGVVEIDYNDFRKNVLGFSDIDKDKSSYSVFSQFNKRILKPCMDEMKKQAEEGVSDCYFDFEKIYNSGKRAANPDRLRFHIYLSDLGKAIKEDRVSTKDMMGVERRLRSQFDQTERQVRQIMKSVPVNLRMELARKMDQLLAMEQDGRIKIDKNRRSYFNCAFCDFISEIENKSGMMSIPFPNQDPTPENQSVKTDGTDKEDGGSKMTEEENAKWERFISELSSGMNEKDYSMLSAFGFFSFDGKMLVVSSPTRVLAEIFMSRYKDVLNASVSRVYGAEVSCMFKAV